MDALVLRDKSSERLYAMQDANWNVVAIADATAVVQERYAYSPYGVPVFLTPTFTSRASSSFTWQRLFTGQTYDTPTGLHYFRNRMLHSQVGTFITRDPIGYADGLHVYRAWFVLGRVDPTGLIPWDPVQDGKVDQLPLEPNWGEGASTWWMFSQTFHRSFNAIMFDVKTAQDCNSLADKIFDEMAKFDHFDDGQNDLAKVRLEKTNKGTIAWFRSIGLGGAGMNAIGNSPEMPVLLTVDKSSRTILGTTLRGHFLEGQRVWRIFAAPLKCCPRNTCRLMVYTEAYERKIGTLNRNLGQFDHVKQIQMSLWTKYLRNIRLSVKGIEHPQNGETSFEKDSGKTSFPPGLVDTTIQDQINDMADECNDI